VPAAARPRPRRACESRVRVAVHCAAPPAHRKRISGVAGSDTLTPRAPDPGKGPGAQLFLAAHAVQEESEQWAKGSPTSRFAQPKCSAPTTKERIASKLAEFTDDELAAMGLSRKKGNK
jgi:hypothetical protein